MRPISNQRVGERFPSKAASSPKCSRVRREACNFNAVDVVLA